MAKAKLSDIRPSKLKFKPGDRVLIKTNCSLNKSDGQKIRRAVRKFAGCEVRALLVNCLLVRIVRICGSLEEVLCSPADSIGLDGSPRVAGVASLNCSVVEFKDGDILYVTIKDTIMKGGPPPEEKRRFKKYLKEWTGNDVEVKVEGAF